ncbi:expressed unknown protein [Nannochloropsis gaditana]|uniref:Uncharacterized protein n=1 Tax=Nannochloropsis gaditana TaxID=72520 RepID=W7U5L9_9STRA|nr:expressed unknown protein [Nannochloropsis gaditana]
MTSRSFPILLVLVTISVSYAFMPQLSTIRPRLTRCESSLQNRRSSSPSPRRSAAGTLLSSPRVRFEGFEETRGPAVGDTLSIVYDPAGEGADSPLTMLEEDEGASPCLLYNFNGWNGEETPLRTPLFPQGDGTLMATVHVPNYAKVLDCIVSDGQLAFDTEAGQFFHLRIAHVQEERDGTVYNFFQGEDGSITLTGVQADNDARELERMIEEELSARETSSAEGQLFDEEPEERRFSSSTVADYEESHLSDLEGDSEEAGEGKSPLSEDADAGGEAARQLASSGSLGVHVAALEDVGNVPQQLRAEATAVGEALGISSSMIINELRESFDSVTDADVLTIGELPKALARMGFDGLEAAELEDLCMRVQGTEAPAAGRCLTLEHFMRIFHLLDTENVGIVIV